MDKEALIILYFENRLSPEEALLFNEYVQNDPDFAAEVQFRKELKVTLHLQERQALKELLQQHEQATQPKQIKRFNWQQLRVAAVVIAVIVSCWLLLQPSANEHEKLYAKYFDVYPNVVAPVTRSAIPDSNTLITKAFLLYEAGHYPEAGKIFGELAQEPNYAWSLFYAGICQMQGQHFKEAITNFGDYLAQAEDELFREESLWYTSLCQLQLQQNKEAMQTLQSVVQLKGKRVAEATELLKALE